MNVRTIEYVTTNDMPPHMWEHIAISIKHHHFDPLKDIRVKPRLHCRL